MGGNAVFDGQLEFVYVNPKDLREYWPLVKDGVEAVNKNSKSGWLTEDMYMALANNHSTLHVGYVGQEYLGFMVLTPQQDYNGTTLHVWATYCKKDGFDLMSHGIVEINQLACRINAKAITFDSPRKGWEKYAKKLDFMPISVKWARKVKYD